MYRLDDRLFYANCQYVCARILEAIAKAPERTSYLVFDAEGIPNIDASGVEALEQLVKQLAEQDITVVVARLKEPLARRFDTVGLTELIGAQNFAPTVDRAVESCRPHPVASRST